MYPWEWVGCCSLGAPVTPSLTQNCWFRGWRFVQGWASQWSYLADRIMPEETGAWEEEMSLGHPSSPGLLGMAVFRGVVAAASPDKQVRNIGMPSPSIPGGL